MCNFCSSRLALNDGFGRKRTKTKCNLWSTWKCLKTCVSKDFTMCRHHCLRNIHVYLFSTVHLNMIIWSPWCITNLCWTLGRFSILLGFVQISACELQFDWKTLSGIFFTIFFHFVILENLKRYSVCKKCFFLCTQRNQPSMRVVRKLHYLLSVEL